MELPGELLVGADGADHSGHRGQEPGQHGGPGPGGNMCSDGGIHTGITSPYYC